ncbi:DUF4167 domain-containing protein [Croceibacterium mercuriale]|uniref:DUF4167 domain-containing protein n=1 Tax=Croceibacterium mercuriale TaxID=1572751 RepID=UPI00068F71E2|nr:DUF4167 domain-containing protein [Croceibacterium mercuriale]
MNTNRNNNRRRGRNNSGRGQSGGGNGGGNRIDSRARGNAPQMLEKYRKLAHDASLNDDRVQTEYYLQFADHYFRVLADSKQKDGSPARSQNDRGQSFDDYDDEEDEFENGARATPRGRPDPARDSNRDSSRETGRDGNRRNDAEQGDGDFAEQTASEQQRGGEDVDSAGVENPFIRDTGRRGRRPRGAADGDGAVQAEPRTRTDGETPAEPRIRTDGAAPAEGRGRGRPRRAPVTETQEDTGFDAMVLPPSISRSDDADSTADAVGESDGAQDAPAARTRKAPARPRRRAARTDEGGPEDGAGETLEIVG